ncbi:DUF1659 domain-containing protein [Bacillus niameyensis]|uniref:DUF1659 domain-containing protein n=1 Tax=Bacillus niameyensis TaxID=1522308 RepID=UPI00078136D6|nr:DUF1659 domain-containing protein [Bacillus niameyensis]
MAQEYLKTSSLKLVFDYGLDENDKPVYKSKTFNRIRQQASADELYEAAEAIGSLSEQPLWAVEKNNTYQIG